MLAMLNYLKARYLGERGQGMVEYVAILAFVVVVAGIVFSQGTSSGLGKALDDAITSITAKITVAK